MQKTWTFLKQAAARATPRRFSLTSFKDRVVCVTGGSRGLGLLIAETFARQGAKLAICARDEGELAAARERLEKLTPHVVTVACDLTREEAIEDFVARAEAMGPIEVLVNNAGRIEVGPLETMTAFDFEQALNTNLLPAVRLTLRVLPAMRARRSGRIVNIASIGGVVSVPHLLPYCTSKFALRGFSEGLAAEVRKDGVRVTTVCPGLMRTGSARHATFSGDNRAEFAWFSISDSLPLTSVSANRAARRIVRACARGEAHVIISPQAKLAALAHGVFPSSFDRLMAGMSRVLPKTPATPSTAKGSESASPLSPSVLTALGDKAAAENNQMSVPMP